jgi:hypothetical protein
MGIKTTKTMGFPNQGKNKGSPNFPNLNCETRKKKQKKNIGLNLTRFHYKE